MWMLNDVESQSVTKVALESGPWRPFLCFFPAVLERERESARTSGGDKPKSGLLTTERPAPSQIVSQDFAVLGTGLGSGINHCSDCWAKGTA